MLLGLTALAVKYSIACIGGSHRKYFTEYLQILHHAANIRLRKWVRYENIVQLQLLFFFYPNFVLEMRSPRGTNLLRFKKRRLPLTAASLFTKCLSYD